AGAINTMLIAALGDRSKNKSNRIREILFSWKFEDFMDGKSIVKRVASRLLKSKNYMKKTGIAILILLITVVLFPFLMMAFKINLWWYLAPFLCLCIIIILAARYYRLFKVNNIGLNPGKAFENKMKTALENFNIRNVSNLNEEYNKSG